MVKVIDRIYEYLEYHGISVNEFSKNIGVSNGYFAKQRAAQGDVGSQIVEKMVRRYPAMNIDWLITGNGEMDKEMKPPEGVVEVSPGKFDVAADRLIAALDYSNKLLETQAKNIERLEAELKKREEEIARLTEQGGQKKKAS